MEDKEHDAAAVHILQSCFLRILRVEKVSVDLEPKDCSEHFRQGPNFWGQ